MDPTDAVEGHAVDARHRFPNLTLLRLAMAALTLWLVWEWTAPFSEMTPAQVSELARQVIVGLTALAAFDIVLSGIGWALSRLNDHDAPFERHERIAAERADPPRRYNTCPACWATHLEDTPACPWCGQPLD